MTIYEWIAYAKRRTGHTAMRAQYLADMLPAVERHVAAGKDTAADRRALMRLIGDYRPTLRSRHPGIRAWNDEVRKLRDALASEDVDPDPPTTEDIAACEVAADLVELGRVDEARKILDEQAPRRLSWKCPACFAPRGQACIDADAVVQRRQHTCIMSTSSMQCRACNSGVPYPGSTERVVPHMARLIRGRVL